MRVFVGTLSGLCITVAACVDPAGSKTAENLLIATENQTAIDIDALVD